MTTCAVLILNKSGHITYR